MISSVLTFPTPKLLIPLSLEVALGVHKVKTRENTRGGIFFRVEFSFSVRLPYHFVLSSYLCSIRSTLNFDFLLQTSTYVSSHFPEYWTNPEEFDPYRFDDEELVKRYLILGSYKT